jgi:hypothetical protein
MSHTLSGKYATPLYLEVGPSRLMAVWLLLVAVAALLVLTQLQLPGWLDLLVTSAVLYGLLMLWRKLVRRSHPDAVRSMLWGEGRHCRLTLNSGQQQAVELASHAFILPWLVILYFETPLWRQQQLVLLPDMLDVDVLRRLRVRLKIETGQTGQQ